MIILCTSPYIRKSDDQLHQIAQTEIFLVLSAGWLFYNLPSSSYYSESDDATMSVALIFITILIFGLFLYQGFRMAYRYLSGEYSKWRTKKDKQEARDKAKAEAAAEAGKEGAGEAEPTSPKSKGKKKKGKAADTADDHAQGNDAPVAPNVHADEQPSGASSASASAENSRNSANDTNHNDETAGQPEADTNLAQVPV